jgi:hypothetical protein
VARQLVVAFRMPPAGVVAGPEGAFLVRARSLCARGEALGARMIAWTGTGLALAWDSDSIEEAILSAVSIREEALAPERAWACGIAEGELEPLAPDGQRMHLASGAALLAASSLARVAKAAEVLVDGDVRALRAGQLTLLGARTATDGGQRVRGWRLDLEHPWKRGVLEFGPVSPDATDRLFAFQPEADVMPGIGPASAALDAAATQPLPAVRFAPKEPGTRPWGDDNGRDVRELVNAIADPSAPPPSPLVDRVRRMALGEDSADAVEVLAELRRARTAAEGGPPSARCQASLALAMTLAIAQRPEEALLEALDALARAREAQDTKAISACSALLAKLYVSAGHGDEASALLKAGSSE